MRPEEKNPTERQPYFVEPMTGREWQPFDMKVEVEEPFDNEVVYTPLTEKGWRFLDEAYSFDRNRPNDKLCGYWKGTDTWSRERRHEAEEQIGEMVSFGLELDFSALPARVRKRLGW